MFRANSGVDSDIRMLVRDILEDVQRSEGGREGAVPGFPQRLWSVFEKSELTRLTGGEDKGGSGGSWFDAAALLGESALHGIATPYVEHDLLGGWLRDVVRCKPLGTGIATATLVSGHAARWRSRWLDISESVVVLDARLSDSPLFYELPTDGLTWGTRQGLDGLEQFEVEIEVNRANGVAVPCGAVNEWWLRGALSRAIQMAGAMEGASSMALDHALKRVQFGRELGRFPAVQRLVIDAILGSTLSWAVVDRAVDAVATLGFDHAHSRFLVASAKLCCGLHVDTVVRNTHQIHGAIGTTREHGLHRLTRPLLSWQREFGGVQYWERRIEDWSRSSSSTEVWDFVSR